MSHLSEDQLDRIIAEERSRGQAPLNEWRTIAARAREEGLIRESQSSRWGASSEPWLRSAAAGLLLGGGSAIARATMALPSAVQATAAKATPTANANFASVENASAPLNRAVD